MAVNPPYWAETLLFAILPVRDRESIPADLLEAYRDSISPQRGPAAADRWYVRQVAGLTLRFHAAPALLFGAIYVGRVGLDAFAPTHDFSVRSAVTTLLAVAIWVATGVDAVRRTTRLRSAAIGGLAAAMLACLTIYPMAGMLLVAIATLGDGSGWTAIPQSGGAAEIFMLPAMVVLPAIVLATLGGATALLVRRVRALV